MKRPSVGMKLHTPEDEGGFRIADFYSEQDNDYQIAVVDDATLDNPKVNTVHLTRREAQALRHWLDSALT